MHERKLEDLQKQIDELVERVAELETYASALRRHVFDMRVTRTVYHTKPKMMLDKDK